MHSNSAYHIGKKHQVCQDYTLHGSRGNAPYVILSDGCSGSPHTDIGARIISNLVRKQLKQDGHIYDYDDHLNIILDAYIHTSKLDISPACLDATLLILAVDAEYKECKVVCYGDGVIVKIRKDGTIEVIEIQYTSGAPFYLNYHADDIRKKLYLEKFGNERIITKYILAPDGQKIINKVNTYDDYSYREIFSIKDYVAAAVMSDGMMDFSSPQCHIDCWQVLNNLLPFKNYAGLFVERRLNRFLKEFNAAGCVNNDDVSMASVYFGE